MTETWYSKCSLKFDQIQVDRITDVSLDPMSKVVPFLMPRLFLQNLRVNKFSGAVGQQFLVN